MAGSRKSREYPDRPIVGVVAVVQRDERFLLVRRGREPNKGKWGFPGGVQELGEGVIAAALRELSEETAVGASDPRVLTVLDAIDRDEKDAIRRHYTLIAVALAWTEGEGIAGDDADELGWFAPAELDGLAILPGVVPLIALARVG
jgi:8-oxo-dGTP diphosphatase